MTTQQSKNTIKHAQAEGQKYKDYMRPALCNDVGPHEDEDDHEIIIISIPTFYNIDEIDL